MKKKIVFFPFNGNAIEALDCLDETFEFIGFVDDAPKKIGTSYLGFKIFDRRILENKALKILAVPGSPTSFLQRQEIIASLKLENNRFENVVHPKAVLSKTVELGTNNLIMAGTVLTSNFKMGSHNCLLPNSVLHHDSIIGNFNLIGSSVVVAGNVRIGNNNYIGSGSKFKNGLEIGDKNLIGLGANVLKNFESFKTIYGNPAKEI